MLGGAIGGASQTLATNFVFGIGNYFEYDQPFFNEGNTPIQRSAGIAALFGSNQGINWGRTAYSRSDSKDIAESEALKIHEATHWRQQNKHGFALFYGRTAVNYGKAMIDSRSFNFGRVYNSAYPTPCLNYENGANGMQSAYKKLRTNFLNSQPLKTT